MADFVEGDHVEIQPWSSDPNAYGNNLWGKTATIETYDDYDSYSGPWLALDEPIPYNGDGWSGDHVYLDTKHLVHTDPEQAAAAKVKAKIAAKEAAAKAKAAKAKAKAEAKAEAERIKKEQENILITCHCKKPHINYLSGDFYQPLWWTKDEQFCAVVKAPADFYEQYPHGGTDCAPELRIDPVQLAADFYLLEATKNGMLGDNDDPALLDEAKEQFDRLVGFAAPLMREYLWWSVCSELTYHSAFKASFNCDEWRHARYGWDLLIQHYGEEQACDWAMETFTQEGMWGGAFGGKPWANIVQVLKYKAIGKIGKKPFSDAMFLDRMFSLQHNTCTVFNKCSFTIKNDWSMGIDRMTCGCSNKPDCGCKNVLNMHAQGNMIGMLALASPAVVKIVQDQWSASGYGKIEPEKSPYCKKGCGSWSMEGEETCAYHTEKPCSECESIQTASELNNGKCYACYNSIDMAGYAESIGKDNCWNCNSDLLKDSSKLTGFCSVCRQNLKASGKKTMKKFLADSVFLWNKCECDIPMTPAYVGNGCPAHPKNKEAFKAYTYLMDEWGGKPKKAVKKAAKKAPAKKQAAKKKIPVVKNPGGLPSFAELLAESQPKMAQAKKAINDSFEKIELTFDPIDYGAEEFGWDHDDEWLL